MRSSNFGRRRAATIVGSVAIVFIGIGPGFAQDAVTLGLAASAIDVQRLAPDAPMTSSVFWVNDATEVLFDVFSSDPGIGITLTMPDGTVLDPTSIGTIGGTADIFDFAPGGSGPLILPGLRPGHHVLFAIPNPIQGDWALGFSEPGGNADEIAVITQMFLESPTQVGLLAHPHDLVLGGAVTLTFAAFTDEEPILGGMVEGQLVSPAGTLQTVNFVDDGTGPDATVADGLYSAAVIPEEIGEHTMLARLDGVTPGGISIVREAATIFNVVPPSSALLGSVDTRTLDANLNGLIDELVLDVSVNILLDGEFLVNVVLTASNGESTRGMARSMQNVGSAIIPVSFSAAQILALGVDGPYNIGPVEVQFLLNAGAVTGDVLTTAGETPAILQADFEGFVEEQLVCDADSDGDIDINDITVIVAARGQRSEPGDPRDADGDGTITVLDARSCVAQCSNPRCAQ